MEKYDVIVSIYNSETITYKKFLILKGNLPIHHVKKQLKLWGKTPHSCLKGASCDDASITVPCSSVWLVLIIHTHSQEYGFSHLKEPVAT